MNWEYTLEDAFDQLQERKTEEENNIEELINILSNNETFTLKTSSSLEDVKMKQEKLRQSLLEEIQQMEPKDTPILRTSDSRLELMTDMERDIHNMEELHNNLQKKLSDIQEDITYLKNKKSGLEKMQEVYLDARNTSANKTYKEEVIVAKRIFKEVKKDMNKVIDTIFPDSEDLKDLLARLTSAYLKGGDDVYIDVEPQFNTELNYLFEADLIEYHRNDKTKIRMAELL